MGWLSSRRSPRLDDHAMTRLFRAFAFLALGLLLGGSASYSFAGYAQLKPPANIGGTVGARVSAGAFAANAGNISVGFTTQVAGRAVTMPATMRFASNAARVAIGAVRLSPAALVGSAVAAWLLTQGIEYLDGQLQKATPDAAPRSGFNWNSNFGCGAGCSYAQAVESVIQNCEANAVLYACEFMTASFVDGTTYKYTIRVRYHHTSMPVSWWGEANQGYVYTTSPRPNPLVPAVEADFSPLETAPLPDDVAEELAPKAVPLPLENPQFDPTPQIIPLSDPYPKRGGQPGETVKDVAKVTPAPDEKVKIEPEVQPVTGPNGVPIPTTNPDGSANPEAAGVEKPDFCIENPDALACWKDGEPEDVDLAKDSKNVAITPQGGWGPDTATCPQPRKHVLKNGYTVQMSWEPVCDGAGMFRPVVLGLAWLAAIYAFMAMYRKSQS